MHVIIKIPISYKDRSTYPSLNLWTSLWTRQMWLSSFCIKRQLFSETPPWINKLGFFPCSSLFIVSVHLLSGLEIVSFHHFCFHFQRHQIKSSHFNTQSAFFFLCIGIMEFFENYMESMDSSQNIAHTHKKLGLTWNHTRKLCVGSKIILILTNRLSQVPNWMLLAKGELLKSFLS